MADASYVRQYFSERASEWLARAYGTGLPSRYPIGANRIRVTMEALARRLGAIDGNLIDLGCGGGDLCLAAVSLGPVVTGIDIADAMIREAEAKKATLSTDLQQRVSFRVGNALNSGLPADSFRVATALGLIEYLPDDGQLFREANRLLVPGGVLIVSCRNRLFNMASFNDYTAREVESDGVGVLLAELRTLADHEIPVEAMAEFMYRLKSLMPQMEAALAADSEGAGTARRRSDPFAQPRRQHTPSELWASARSAGFEHPSFSTVHPHPLPPQLEAVAPHLYNQLARAFEAFETHAMSFLWSSAFIGVFRKPAS
jgi:2-polyprenyl-3-methyl-5-hydroxy-6-metoxy-1,4-benzoquinol methylase